MVLYPSNGTGERILKLLKSTKEYGGPQSTDDICKSLGMTNRNARSILSRMCKSGKIERKEAGVYSAIGDKREYSKDMSHYNE